MKLPKFSPLKWIITLTALLVVAAVAAVGIHKLSSSSAATGLAVRVPTNSYFGGSDTMLATAAFAPSGCGTNGYMGVECEYAWAAKQQGLTAPYATTSDGVLHTSTYHEYIGDCTNTSEVNAYKQGGNEYNKATVTGRKVFLLNIKCGTPAAMASGSMDSYIRKIVDILDTYPIPVITNWHHEPENDGCSASFNPDNYRAAFRHFVAVQRDEESKNGKHNLDTAFILMNNTYTLNHTDAVYTSCAAIQGPSVTSTVYRNPENWWPGDDVVDWIGTDAYTAANFQAMGQTINDWGACPAKHPTTNYNCTSARINKPKMISEFGDGLQDYFHSPTEIASFMDGMRTTIKANSLPRIKLYAWFKTINPPVFNSKNQPTSASGDLDHLEAKALARVAYDPAIAIPKFGTVTPPAPTPPPPPPTQSKVVTLNDATNGTGLNQFSYIGQGWLTDTTNSPNAYNKDNHHTSVSGLGYQVRFNGTQIKIYTEKNVGIGISDVTIDGGAVTKVDGYATTRQDQSLVYTSPVLALGTHTLKVMNTGTKNSKSANTYLTADRVDITEPTTVSSAASSSQVASATEPGDTAVLGASTTATRIGDLNGDQQVNALDYALLLSHYGEHSTAYDLTGDGVVDAADTAVLLSNWTW